MIIENCEQLSEKWFVLRAGNPGASEFDKIVTSTGAPSKQSKQLAYQMAGEKLLGKKAETYTNQWMERGVELEAEAREVYEFITGDRVDTVGLCFANSERKYHCSPDGLIGEDCGIEIKCPMLSTHIEYMDNGKLPTKYIQQVQGSMFVTERPFWVFCSYYPGIEPFIVKVKADKKFHAKLEEELNKFCEQVDQIYRKLKK